MITIVLFSAPGTIGIQPRLEVIPMMGGYGDMGVWDALILHTKGLVSQAF